MDVKAEHQLLLMALVLSRACLQHTSAPEELSQGHAHVHVHLTIACRVAHIYAMEQVWDTRAPGPLPRRL